MTSVFEDVHIADHKELLAEVGGALLGLREDYSERAAGVVCAGRVGVGFVNVLRGWVQT